MNVRAKPLMLAAAVGAVVLVCLAALSAPKVRRIRTCRENMWAIFQAQKEYYMETGTVATNTTDLIPGHLTKLPVCPSGGSYSISNPSFDTSFGRLPTCSSQNPR